jgi:hypothetical protein
MLCARYLVFVWILQHFFLDFHVSKLIGVEYLTAIQTFDVLNVLFTRYHADFWVFAGGVHLGDLKCVTYFFWARLYPPDSTCQICFCAFHAGSQNLI